MNDSKNWFVHIEWVVVLITLLGGFYLLDGKIERQGQRTDRLYELYVEAREDGNRKWLDTQTEIKKLYMDICKNNERINSRLGE